MISPMSPRTVISVSLSFVHYKLFLYVSDKGYSIILELETDVSISIAFNLKRVFLSLTFRETNEK